jgi:hypothetical protein
MSAGHGFPVRQEDDRVRARRVSAALATVLVVSLALSAWAGWMLRKRERAPVPPPVVSAEVGGVKQTLIGPDTSARALADRGREVLESYGWVDREAGVARIPIEQAMRLVVEAYR